MDYVKSLPEARTLSTALAQEIAKYANENYGNDAKPFAALIGTLVLQTIMTTLAVDQFKPGSPEGEAWMRTMYEQVLKDAVERWHAPDLKIFNHGVQ